MRPPHLTPKLTDADRLQIRRLRVENAREWTLEKLAQKFGIHRSTVSHVLRKRMRVSVEQELGAMRLAVETSGMIETEELLRLKNQEWHRELLAERDLVRQQQLVNLIKTVSPILEAARRREDEWPRTATDFAEDERRALELLAKAPEAPCEAASGSYPALRQSAVNAASAA
jgi:AraC-like DNA-binding protein